MRSRLLLIAAALLLAPAASAAPSPVPAGLWSMPNGKATVRIFECGGSLCATLVGLKKPNDKKGRPKVDKKNPNPALRRRPVVGLALVSGMTREGDAWAGRFYNPDDGQTYLGRILVEGPNRLALKGCVLGGWLCKTQALTRLR